MNDNAPLIPRRKFLRRGAAVALASAAGTAALSESSAAAPAPARRQASLIRRENDKPGARDWQLTRVRLDRRDGFRSPWIEGYCSQQSVSAG